MTEESGRHLSMRRNPRHHRVTRMALSWSSFFVTARREHLEKQGLILRRSSLYPSWTGWVGGVMNNLRSSRIPHFKRKFANRNRPICKLINLASYFEVSQYSRWHRPRPDLHIDKGMPSGTSVSQAYLEVRRIEWTRMCPGFLWFMCCFTYGHIRFPRSQKKDTLTITLPWSRGRDDARPAQSGFCFRLRDLQEASLKDSDRSPDRNILLHAE